MHVSNEPLIESCDPRVGSVRWSPDGREIAYTMSYADPFSVEREAGTFVLTLASGSSRRVTEPGFGVIERLVGWLPDGSGLSIWRGPEGTGAPPSYLFVPADGGSGQALLVGAWGAFGGFAPTAGATCIRTVQSGWGR